ncbi:unnamed protein product [Chrysoparadoxa australica]
MASFQEQSQVAIGLQLYYKYFEQAIDKGVQETIKQWYLRSLMALDTTVKPQDSNTSLGLNGCHETAAHDCNDTTTPAAVVGRVRVALDGVNCTIGGTMEQLLEHIEQVKTHPVIQGHDIDFKLSKSNGALSHKAKIESGFEHLSVRCVPEVVTLGAQVEVKDVAPHVTPQEFHQILSQGDTATDNLSDQDHSSDHDSGVVLLDCRNSYESAIGQFQASHIKTITCDTRKFSELPSFLEQDCIMEELRGKKIMMYCTGGVRCERASAFLRSKGQEFDDCVQLSGGIERYLQAYPSSETSLFKGRNFVFDERVAVAPAAGPIHIIGKCHACGSQWDDYSNKDRCSSCRSHVITDN